MRHGQGYILETSQSGSRYSGNWSNDQYHDYGIYDDKVRYHTSLNHTTCHLATHFDLQTLLILGDVSESLLPWSWLYHNKHVHRDLL